MIVGGGVDSQPGLGAGLTAVLEFVEALDSHGVGLKELPNDNLISIDEVAARVCACKRVI